MRAERESLFDWARLGAPARNALAAELVLDEPVRVVIRGTAGQAILGTDTRLLVLPPFVPGATPVAVPSWPYLDVLGLEMNERAVGGSIALRVPEGETVVGVSGDWHSIRSRVATLRGLVAGAHRDAIPAELRLVAL